MPADSTHPHAAEPAAAPRDAYDLVLEQDDRRFVFRVRPGQESDVLARLSVMADDPDEPLTWYQAALLSDQIGQVLRHRLGDLQQQLHHPLRSAATG